MLQFQDLELKTQITILIQSTYSVDIQELDTYDGMLSHVFYDKRQSYTKLSHRLTSITTTDLLLQAVLTTISQDMFIQHFNLETIRGIVLEKGGKPMFFCSNLCGYDSNQVAVVCMDDLIKSPRFEYYYGDTIPDRWKMLYTGIGFALTTFLLDSVKRFPIIIQ